MHWFERAKRALSRDPMKHVKPLDLPAADPRISSRTVLPKEKLRRGIRNSYGNETRVDDKGGTFHRIVDTWSQAEEYDEYQHKYPREQRIVSRLLKGFVNVDDVVWLDRRKDFFSYQPPADSIPRQPNYDARRKADIVILEKLFNDPEHSVISPNPRLSEPHNLAIGPGRDHMLFDFEHAALRFWRTSVREGTYNPAFGVSDSETLTILISKLIGLKEHYESVSGAELMAAIFRDYPDFMKRNILLRPSKGKGDPIAEFHAEFVSRLALLIEETKRKLEHVE